MATITPENNLSPHTKLSDAEIETKSRYLIIKNAVDWYIGQLGKWAFAYVVMAFVSLQLLIFNNSWALIPAIIFVVLFLLSCLITLILWMLVRKEKYHDWVGFNYILHKYGAYKASQDLKRGRPPV